MSIGRRIDAELIARLERAYGASSADYARRCASADPSCGARVLALREGVVVVDSGAGGGENAHRAYGLGRPRADDSGLDEHGIAHVEHMERVEDIARDLDAIERFYAGRVGAGVHVTVTPPVPDALHVALAQRGYVVTKQSSVLVAASDASDAAPSESTARAGHDVRVLGDDDIDAVLDIIDAIYGPAPDGRDVAHARSLPLFRAPTTMFGAFVDGTLAACGALVVEPAHRVGLLFAGVCHPTHRGRRLQGALIAARMARAHALGLDLVTSLTAPASTSERNLRRAGFILACTQSVHSLLPRLRAG